MEKKFKFTDKSALTKIIYAAVIAILCITAIVIGIVSASRKAPDADPPVTDTPGDDGVQDNTPPATDDEDKKEEKLTFSLPVLGEVVKEHSLSAPVFSLTLGEWRVHAGIDISADEKAPVMAAERGVISGIYNDPMHGCTVEITHSDDIKTRYSNLDGESVKNLAVGDEVAKNAVIGAVGDTSVTELAEEPHLHFEMLVKNVKVNPLDYINLTDNGDTETT